MKKELARYSELYHKKRDLTRALNDLKVPLEEARDALLGKLAEAGMSKVTWSGQTYSPKRTLWIGRSPDLDATTFYNVLQSYPDLAGFARA